MIYLSDQHAANEGMVQSIFTGATHDTAALALASGSPAIVRGTVEALEAATAALLAAGAVPADAFLLKPEAIRHLELRTAKAEALEARVMAMADYVTEHRTWITKATVTATKATADIPTVRVASLPERVTVQDVERDARDEITRTVSVERDA